VILICLRPALERFRGAVGGFQVGVWDLAHSSRSSWILRERPSGPAEFRETAVFTGIPALSASTRHRSAYSTEDLQRNGRFNPSFAGGKA
jgi:hypothetical protein